MAAKLPRGFGRRLRQLIRSGIRPQDAMGQVWHELGGRRRARVRNPRLWPAPSSVSVVTPAGGKVFQLGTPARSVALSVGNPRRASRAKFCPERLESPAAFDPRSLRTVKQDGHRITVGCPKGDYDAKRKRCRVGTRAQRILHPAGEPGTCPVPGLEVNPGPYKLLAIDMLEAGRPVVRHIFYGATAAEASSVMRAHAQADASFHAALTGQPYRGVRIEARRVSGGELGNPVSPRSWWCPHHGQISPVKMRGRPGPRCPMCFAAAQRPNPLTRAETARVLKDARTSAQLGRRRRPPSLTAPGARDPVERAAHRGWWYGRADALVTAARMFGPVRRRRGARRPASLVMPPSPFARGTRISMRGFGPGHALINPPPGAVQIYGRVIEIKAEKGPRSRYPGQRFFHRFRAGGPIYGLPDGSLLIQAKRA